MTEFNHIHCSSRFDRSAVSLESDVDDWRQQASIITLTEVNNDQRAVTLREKGWGYYNSPLGGGRDDGAICWDSEVWRRLNGHVVRLSRGSIAGRGNPLWACTATLHHRNSGKKMLVAVTHFPAAHGATWAQRKVLYLRGLKIWSTHVHAMQRRAKADGVLVCADWNLNLKDRWVFDLLHSSMGLRSAWQNFPTAGGSRIGGPSAPAGAPGHSGHDRIIDGSLYQGLKVADGPHLMSRVSSSDHRPYRERFAFAGKNDRPDDHQPSGDVKHGEAWWGFGDYMTDEIYDQNVNTGAAGGEVL